MMLMEALAATVVAITGLTSDVTPQAVAPSHFGPEPCAVRWGSLPESEPVPPETFDARGFHTFESLVFAAGLEDRSVLGLGVRARLPFRVFVLDGSVDKGRVVVDVAHEW